jgi:hypothetical protein
LLLLSLLLFAQPALAQLPAIIPPAAFIARIDAADLARHTSLAAYTVQEHYSVFRNTDPAPVAEMTVSTRYTLADGKQYASVSQSGSALFRRLLLDKVLASEHDMNLPANRSGYFLNSSNYQMQVNPTPVLRNGRLCYLVTLTARRKSQYLFNGRACFDATDGTLVHLEGSPTQAPSFLAGVITIDRDYTSMDGFSMAIHAEAHSHSLLVGDTVLKIDYSGYQLQPVPAH